MQFYALRNILLGAIYTLVVFMSCCRNCVMYVRLDIFIHFKERLPEAICCLQTCNVDVVLLVMHYMYVPAFIVTSADISQLWVYLCYLLISGLRLVVVVYIQTCNVYRVWVTLYCMCVQTFVVC